MLEMQIYLLQLKHRLSSTLLQESLRSLFNVLPTLIELWNFGLWEVLFKIGSKSSLDVLLNRFVFEGVWLLKGTECINSL